MLRRTVILLQFDYFRIGKYMFKIQNILNICSAELVDGLIIITYHAQIVIFAGQNADQLKLYCIGILILIYHNVAEPFLIVFQYIRTALKQFHCLHQQIVKIQCSSSIPSGIPDKHLPFSPDENLPLPEV